MTAMGSARISIKTWYRLHKWTSLICTVFLFVICLTGLPLVFEDEINHLLSNDPPYAVLPADAPMANLDRMIHSARERYPGQVVDSVFIDDEEPQVQRLADSRSPNAVVSACAAVSISGSRAAPPMTTASLLSSPQVDEFASRFCQLYRHGTA
jgi:uncharacterized iron-regulated membrane protein